MDIRLGATITLDTASITGNTALNITRTDPTIGEQPSMVVTMLL